METGMLAARLITHAAENLFRPSHNFESNHNRVAWRDNVFGACFVNQFNIERTGLVNRSHPHFQVIDFASKSLHDQVCVIGKIVFGVG
jgi:hypothetical protein